MPSSGDPVCRLGGPHDGLFPAKDLVAADAGGLFTVFVDDPFGRVAEHVVKSPGVGLLLPN
jgi:hypothetical protein